MPIAFYDSEEITELGTAAYFHVEAPSPESQTRFGALLFLNARGEPQEFIYNRLELMSGVLWRTESRANAAVRRLAVTLFSKSTLTPSLLFCQTEAVDPGLFGPSGLSVDVPVGCLCSLSDRKGEAGSENAEQLATFDEHGTAVTIGVLWATRRPDGTSASLLERLVKRGLLLEPFTRASSGLREVYGSLLDSSEASETSNLLPTEVTSS